MTAEKTAKTGSRKFLLITILILVIIAGIGGYYYMRYFRPNVTGKEEYLYIHSNATYADMYKTIQDKGIVQDTASFNASAQSMHYTSRVKPGKYRLREGMTNRKLINMLASGAQEPVELSFHNLRLKEEFAGFVAKKIEPDSVSILRLLDSTEYLKQYGFTTDDVYTMFIPNTYQLYWNNTPDKFFKRMYAHYEKFWTAERKQEATEMNLTPIQVTIFASIVDAEALHDDEMPIIAGLYFNRMKKGMKLESDPTVIFALKDFTIRRVLNKYLSYNSPYNTYMYAGLPPGPIMMPSVAAIDAVLNYRKTDYIYMCAKADFSGYHAFATNMADHLVNAHKFQQALNERNIKK